MLIFFALLKWLLVALLEMTGIGLLALGLGVQIGSIKYQGFEATGVPAGIAVMAAGIALAYFWRITAKRTEEWPSENRSTGLGMDLPVKTTTEYSVSVNQNRGDVQL